MSNDTLHDYQYGNQGNQAGLPAGSLTGTDYDADGSFIGGVVLEYGDPVFGRAGDVTKVWGPNLNKAVVLWGADFVASNTIDAVINGVNMTQAVYATSQAVTLAAIVTAINNTAGIAALGIYAVATGAREITLHSDNEDLTGVNFTVAAGASQATETVTYSEGDQFMGFIIRATVSYQTNNTNVQINDALAFLKRGRIVARAAATLTNIANQKAYLVVDSTSADYKKLTTTASGNLDIGVYFRGNVSAGLVEVEVMSN